MYASKRRVSILAVTLLLSVVLSHVPIVGDRMPEPGSAVPLKPVQREAGWVGDFGPISAWNPIAPARSKALDGAAPRTSNGVQLQPGLRVLFAVGVKADGSRSASRPALAVVR